MTPQSPSNSTTGSASGSVTTEPLKLTVTQLEQYSQLGDKTPDGGQYVVVTAQLRNQLNQDIALSFKDFKIETDPNKPENHYEQGIELGMSALYGKTAGPEAAKKLLNTDTLHPRFDLERRFIFALPKQAILSDYSLKYQPTEKTLPVRTPLVSTETRLSDLR